MDTDTQPETAQNARDSNNLNDFAQLNNNDFTLVAQHTYLGGKTTACSFVFDENDATKRIRQCMLPSSTIVFF